MSRFARAHCPCQVRRPVLENDVIFESVTANRTHYEAAADALSSADRGWLSRLITRRVPLSDWPTALDRDPEDVKVILEFESAV
jgi:glucose 1-dehydrogenase